MIRINLLPVQADRQRQYGRQQLAAGLVLILFEVALLFFVYNNKQSELEQVQRQVADVQAEVDELQAQNDEIDRLNDQKDQLQTFGNVLESLEANRAGPVQMLDELKAMLNAPSNDLQRVNQQRQGWDTTWDPTALWLTSFSEEEGNVKIEGRARTNDDIAEFNIRLASSPYFSHVRLNSTRVESAAGIGRVYAFELTTRVNYNIVDEG